MRNIKRKKNDYVAVIAAVGLTLVFAEIVFLLAGNVIGLACDILNYNGVWVLVASVICTILVCVAIVSSILSE